MAGHEGPGLTTVSRGAAGDRPAARPAPRLDSLELWLTLCLPWLAVVVVLAVGALLTRPAPLAAPRTRLLIAGAPAPGYAGAEPLARPRLFDLSRSAPDSLQPWRGPAVPRAAVTFDPNRVSAAVSGRGLDDEHFQVRVEALQPVRGEPQLLVAARPYRVLPAPAWDVFVYEIGAGAPQPVAVRLDEPAPLTLSRDGAGRWQLESEPLRRRNLALAWTGGGYELCPVDGPWAHMAWLWSGLLAPLDGRLWSWPLLLVPLAGLVRAARSPLVALRARWLLAETRGARAAALLPLLPALGGAVGAGAVVTWALSEPHWDLVTALVAPVLLAAGAVAGLRAGLRCRGRRVVAV